MITIGSVSRERATQKFGFLAEKYSGRRAAIKEFTHRAPDFVFWIYPDGKVHDAKDAHRRNVPKGFAHILSDEPDYGGFLRGRVASNCGDQVIVVYCRPESLACVREKMEQFLEGVSRFPVPLSRDVLVVSDNGDIYGTLDDIERRLGGQT